MAEFFEGPGSVYDPEYYASLTQCFQKWDDTLMVQAHSDAWEGVMKYYQTNGTDSDYMGKPDHWGGCQPETDPRCKHGDYIESKQGKQAIFGEGGVLIYEPCNYSSNIAFYRAATRICDYPNWSID